MICLAIVSVGGREMGKHPVHALLKENRKASLSLGEAIPTWHPDTLLTLRQWPVDSLSEA
eukprot:6185176-Pleurochrysis_carterae.AAC.2